MMMIMMTIMITMIFYESVLFLALNNRVLLLFSYGFVCVVDHNLWHNNVYILVTVYALALAKHYQDSSFHYLSMTFLTLSFFPTFPIYHIYLVFYGLSLHFCTALKTPCHLPYEITQCYLPAYTSEPILHTSQPGRPASTQFT